MQVQNFQQLATFLCNCTFCDESVAKGRILKNRSGKVAAGTKEANKFQSSTPSEGTNSDNPDAVLSESRNG